MKKVTVNELYQIISEQIEEIENVDMNLATRAIRLSRDSIDDQIDAMILKYENESIFSPSDQAISESLSNLNLGALMLEQEEDTPEEDEEDEEASPGEEADDAEASEPTGNEDTSVEEPAVEVKKPSINLDEFTKKVARLTINYNAMLDVPTVIVNRALRFLKENYDKTHVDKMIEVLNNEFDFNLNKKREERRPPPAAVGAFGGGDGLGSGGGGAE